MQWSQHLFSNITDIFSNKFPLQVQNNWITHLWTTSNQEKNNSYLTKKVTNKLEIKQLAQVGLKGRWSKVKGTP